MNSSELKGFLTGLIFGDAIIDHGVTKRALRIKSINKDFIDNIYNELTSCTNFDIKVLHNDAHFSSGCNHKESWELVVKAIPYFAKKYHHFYDDKGKRHTSKEALDWINPMGLANWYMSDGYVCHVGKESGHIYNRRVEFATDRYGEATVEKMIKMLETKFEIKSSKIKRGKFYRIRIKTESYARFIDLVSPHMVDSMRYKLYLAYENQPKWMSDTMWKAQKSLCSAITLTDNAEG